MARKFSKIGHVVSAIFLNSIGLVTSQAMNDPPVADGGLNRHEELVVFSCVAVVFVMSITIVLFLWYVVDRTRERISHFERHLPKVVDKFRQEVVIEAEENDHNGRVIMAGTTAATGEFQGVHPRDGSRGGRVRLTSFTRKQDVGIGTDFPENQVSAWIESDMVRVLPDHEPARKCSTKAADGSDSTDFVYIGGEYIPKAFLSLERCPPLYAYDNPAYDNPYTENGDSANILQKKPKKGKRQDKRKDKNKSKFSVYESHV